METGQEPAGELLEFLDDLGAANVFVNFDPANMILYGAGDPIEAVADARPPRPPRPRQGRHCLGPPGRGVGRGSPLRHRRGRAGAVPGGAAPHRLPRPAGDRARGGQPAHRRRADAPSKPSAAPRPPKAVVMPVPLPRSCASAPAAACSRRTQSQLVADELMRRPPRPARRAGHRQNHRRPHHRPAAPRRRRQGACSPRNWSRRCWPAKSTSPSTASRTCR